MSAQRWEADWRDDLFVFPVEPGGKTPLVRWRSESAPWDEWTGRWPSGAGFGVDCGRSGLVVIDEDELGAVAAWLGYTPMTYTVRTGKGRHFYFLAPRDAVIRNGVRVAPGVDVRADGGYVVGVGSRHPSGTVYAVEEGSPPVPLPDDLRDRLTEAEATTTVVGEATPGTTLPEVIEEGQRGDVLFRYACSLEGKGLTEAEALPRLHAAWSRCRVPYTERTPERMWEHVVQRYRGGDTLVEVPVANGRPMQVRITAKEILDRVRQDTLRDISNEVRARARHLPQAVQWFGRTGEDFEPSKPEPEPSVLRFSTFPDRHVFAPGYHSLFGAKAVLKTWLCCTALLQEVRKGNVGLFIDYEDTYDDFFRRLYVLGATREQVARIVYVNPPGPLTDDGREQLIRRFDALGQGPTLTVLDSVGMGVAAYGLDDNASGGNGVGTFILDVLMWLKTQWPQVVVGIDHLPKGVNPEHATDPAGVGARGLRGRGAVVGGDASGPSRPATGRAGSG